MKSLVSAAAVLLMIGCAGATRPPESGAPREADEPYPVLLSATADRAAEVKASWTNYMKEQGMNNPPLADLQPVTSTIRSLTTDTSVVIHLPKVGSGTSMSEDETRESLRRFVDATKILIGAEEQQLSLISVTGAGDGTATYQQVPLRYPLRNGYGVVRIAFTADRRVTEFSSTCIPSPPGFQRSFQNLKTSVLADTAATLVSGHSFSYSDASGAHAFTINSGDPVKVIQLVLYPTTSADPKSLNVHLAWEINAGQDMLRLVYVDAITSEILGAA